MGLLDEEKSGKNWQTWEETIGRDDLLKQLVNTL